MPSEAIERETVLGPLRVISAEALIGFKLQALVNNPFRPHDLEDIRALLRAQRDRLNMVEVREYFAMFDRMEMLDGLLDEIADERR